MTKEEKILKLNESNGLCEVCNQPLNRFGTAQLAHCIANTQLFHKKYGSFFVDHPLNVKWTCSLKCNQVCNIGYNKGAVLDKLAEILLYEMKKHNGEN